MILCHHYASFPSLVNYSLQAAGTDRHEYSDLREGDSHSLLSADNNQPGDKSAEDPKARVCKVCDIPVSKAWVLDTDYVSELGRSVWLL